ncbi:MAG: hypothetical protein OXB92_05395 [Acidimicrobiaceae bacterium]|nr:NagC family transcriptional regulator [Acidimicrobiia bacterium]MCY4493273.1 hypothetical protein [Acidimicrobiaceae bacterium]
MQAPQAGVESQGYHAAKSLLKLADTVDVPHAGGPSKLVILTATGYGHERPDGTTVIPITALGP